MSLKSDYYKNMILSVSRGYNKGVPSNAKLMYLLAIMKGIERGVLMGHLHKPVFKASQINRTNGDDISEKSCIFAPAIPQNPSL